MLHASPPARPSRRVPHGLRAILGALPALCVALLAACGGDKRSDVLDVYAASSLQDALREVNDAFRRAHGVKVNLNTAGSGKLSVQIEQGGNCDVFLSAGDHEMDRLAELGLVDAPTRIGLLSNQLVIVERTGEDVVAAPGDLESDAVRFVSLANPDAVPAGRYAREWLRSADLWSTVADKMLPAANVRVALAAVESGGAEVGVVYRTDAAISDEVEIAYEVPLADGPRIRYPAARMLERPEKRRARAQAYLDYLRGPEARAAFQRAGFVVVDGD